MCSKNILQPTQQTTSGGAKWWRFKNSTVDPLVYPFDCSSTKDGRCLRGLSATECLEACESTKGVLDGYYISNKFAPQNSLCVPMDQERLAGQSDVLSKLENKDCFPSTNSTAVETSFFRKGMDKAGRSRLFPDDANAVFVGDKVALDSLAMGPVAVPDSDFQVRCDNPHATLELFGDSLENKLRYGDLLSVVYTAPDYTSTLILSCKDDTLSWSKLREDIDPNTEMFLILPVSGRGDQLTTINPLSNKATPDEWNVSKKVLTNGSPFVLASGNGFSFVESDPVGNLRLQRAALGPEGGTVINHGMIFRFNSQMHAYTCENGLCRKVEIDACSEQGQALRFHGLKVFRDPHCFRSCSWETERELVPTPTPTDSHCPPLESPLSVYTKFFMAARSAFSRQTTTRMVILIYFFLLFTVLLLTLHARAHDYLA